jgi:hypothetical protein
MTRHLVGYSLTTMAAIAVLWLVPMSAAQAPNAAANVPTPRTADGKPDLSGRWGGGADDSSVDVRDPESGKQTEYASYDAYLDALGKGQVNPTAIVVGRQTNYRHGNNDYSGKDAALQRRFTGNPPLYRPEFWEKVQYVDIHGNTEDTSFSCLPGGLPRMGPPSRILQTATDFVFLYNTNAFLNVFDWRVVPADGRPHHPVYSKDQTFILGGPLGGRDASHRCGRVQRSDLARLRRMVPHDRDACC